MAKSEKQRRVNALNGDTLRVRIIGLFSLVVIALALLGIRIGWIQIVATDTYAARALEMQQKDVVLPAQRGAILDRNMEELAVSTGTYKVYLRLKPLKSDNTDPKQWQEKLDVSVEVLSSALSIPKEDLDAKVSAGNNRILVERKIDKTKMSLIRDAMSTQGLRAIEMEENPSRQYPKGAFAAHVLGMVDSEGVGIYGIEKTYDEYLSGITGRRISSTDAGGNPISYGEDKTYSSMDGMNVVTTIDATIQYYAEEEAAKAYKETKSEKVEIVILDPSTGDVLAMSTYPDFDPNTPGVPVDKKQLKEFKKLELEEQTNYVMALWRNPIISDLYEPGSVFKLVTASSALEDGLITPQSSFVCKGSYTVAGEKIKCWIHGSHGTQDLPLALRNSCNPAMMQIVERMDYNRYYQYMYLFGMSQRTGIDLPAEAAPMLQKKKGPVERANMSFGMGLSITPMQMVDAVGAIVNGGVLMQPRIVKGLADIDGNLITEFPTTEIRTVVSKATAKEVTDAMAFISETSPNEGFRIPGYNLGVKTGTSQKLIAGEYSNAKSLVSAVMVAPIDVPGHQMVGLLIVDTPESTGFASTIAVPPLRDLMEQVLRYKNIKPNSDVDDGDSKAETKIKVPKLKGKTLSEATEILEGLGLVCSAEGMDANANPKVVDQYPKAGEEVAEGDLVYVYGKQ
jgi:stage V sporulation protein D (sporulation-specific penicillin-binding protein)